MLHKSFHDLPVISIQVPAVICFSCSSLEPWGLDVDPSDAAFYLELTIGKDSWVETALVKLEMISTSYVLKDKSGRISRIVNENTLTKPDRKGGTVEQNVVWVLEQVPGVGVLARYYQASESHRAPPFIGKDVFMKTRVQLLRNNLVEYLQGIGDLTREKMRR